MVFPALPRPESPVRWLLALLGGLVLPLSFAPFDWWPVGLLSTSLLISVLAGQSPRQSFRTGWAFGIGLWGSGVSWLWVSIHDHGDTSAWLAALMVLFVAVVMGLLSSLQTWTYTRLGLDRRPWLSFPALWVLFEWLRSWLFTGFPWLYVGYGYIDTPLAGFAPMGGVFLVSGLAVFTSVVLCWQLRHIRQPQWSLLAAVVIFWTAGAALKGIAWTRSVGEAQSVSIVQGNIPQDVKWETAMQDKTIAIYRQLSASEWGRDIVLWPEAAITKFLHEALPDLEALDSTARRHHSALITGIPYVDPDGPPYRFYNSVLALGEGHGLYHKQRLVPFGEYIPFESLLRGAMPFFDLPMSSFSWGQKDQSPLLIKRLLVQPSICYEVAYPELLQAQASHADLLVTISNDAWFGASHGPHQHLEMVRMRALETGRYYLRGTNNGISAIIGPKGQILARAPQFTRTVLRGQVYAVHGLTPWLVVGNHLVLLICTIALMLSRPWRQAVASLWRAQIVQRL